MTKIRLYFRFQSQISPSFSAMKLRNFGPKLMDWTIWMENAVFYTQILLFTYQKMSNGSKW